MLRLAHHFRRVVAAPTWHQLTAALAIAGCSTPLAAAPTGANVLADTVVKDAAVMADTPDGTPDGSDASSENASEATRRSLPETAADAAPDLVQDASSELTVEPETADADLDVADTKPEVTVVVVPVAALQVELLWDQGAAKPPGQPLAPGGPDLDLHLAHAKAYALSLCAPGQTSKCAPDLDGDGVADPWFNGNYDCYWYDPHPKWGDPTTGAGNPEMVLDDTDGFGPEIIALKAPENGVLYSIGVHFWDQQDGAATTTATLNVYINGALTAKFEQKMNQCDLWWVTQVQFPGGQLVPFAGNPLPPPSVGKLTPNYGSKIANALAGACKLN